METVDLGGARLHLVVAHPGLPGEAERVVREIARIAPVVVLADVSTDDALKLRTAVETNGAYEPHFVDQLFHDESRRRFGADAHAAPHVLVAAARDARSHRRSFVPLRPARGGLGLFARRRARRAAEAIATTTTTDAFGAAYAAALYDAHAWDAAAEAALMHARAVKALQEGRAPVAALVQAHRAPALRALLAQTPRVMP